MVHHQLICGHWFAHEGTPDPFLGYDGADLRRCTRCKGTFYTDQAAQKKAWKRHKKACRLMAQSEIDAINNLSLEECSRALKTWLKHADGGPETYYLMKRVRALMDDDADGTSEVGFQMHSLARGLIFYPGDQMMTVAASPFMANLLLGDEEDLLNTKTRLIKYELADYNGRPSEDYVEAIEDEGEKAALQKLCDTYDELDDSWGEPSSMSYCYLYFNLLVACAYHGQPSRTSNNDGWGGKFRGGNPRFKTAESLLSTAALRRAMTLWTDPLVLKSCGDAMAPAASLAGSAMAFYMENELFGTELCRKHEVVPGLAFDRLAITCMGELLEKATSAKYAAELLDMLGLKLATTPVALWDAKGIASPWTDLPTERRARVALAIVHYVMNTADDDAGASRYSFSPSVEMPKEALNNIFKTICGMQHPKDEDIANSVWKKAGEDGESIGPEAAGGNGDTRAFLYYLSRGNCPPDKWKDLDVVKLIGEFEDIPRIHKAPADAKAKEKDECRRLAFGDKLHEQLNAIWAR